MTSAGQYKFYGDHWVRKYDLECKVCDGPCEQKPVVPQKIRGLGKDDMELINAIET